MPIFAGTDVQRMLEDNARVLAPARSRDHLARLQARDAEHVLGAEWEVVLLHTLGGSGRVIDPDVAPDAALPGRESTGEDPGRRQLSQPDLLFYPDPAKFAPDSATALPGCLLVEISTVSDSDAEDKNPQQAFQEAFRRLLRKRRLSSRGFRLDFKGELRRKPVEAKPADAPFDPVAWLRPNLNHGKMRLALPSRGQVDSFVKTHLGPWVGEVARELDKPRQFSFDEGGVRLEADYHPARSGFSSGYPAYAATYSVDDNPVANRLRKKAAQLSHSAHRDLPAGIILCDGGCELLADRGGYGGPMSFNLREVISRCLNHPDYATVSFVAILSPEQTFNGWGRYEGLQMKSQAFYNPSASHPVKDGELNVLMRSALLENLPAPVNTAANALHLIAKRGGFPEGAPPSGGFHLPA